MKLRRRSSKRRALDAVRSYLKVKAVAKTVKAVRKTVKAMPAYKLTRTVVRRAPAPVKALPVVAGASAVGAAGAAAARKRRRREPVAA